VERSVLMSRAIWLALLATSACLRAVTYNCTSDPDCGAGVCEPDHLCAFADPACPSGFRYGDLGGDSQCVGGAGTDGGASYTIGGTVTGLVGTLVLQNNGSDDDVITATGPFTFATALDPGAAYSVTVLVQPSMQACSVANASGTVTAAPVTDVAVTCASGGNGIACAGAVCTNGTMKCCHNNDTTAGTCKATSAGCAAGNINQFCDDAGDCGGGSAVCCAVIAANGRLSSDVQCEASPAACTGGATQEYLCDPAAAMPCPGTMTCVLNPMFGWHRCQ
jgi:hypothetical protein